MRVKKNSALRKKASRRKLERVAIFVLLAVAWTWILATFGMVFYHGYYPKPVVKKQQQVVPTAMMLDPPNPVTLNQQPAATTIVQPEIPAESTSNSHFQQQEVPLSTASSSSQMNPHESPLLIFTCSRAEYLEQTLNDILKYIPEDCSIGCPIVVSQDGKNPQVKAVIQDFTIKFREKGIPLVRIEHTSALRGGSNAYQALAVHYGWALQQVFDGKAYSTAASNNKEGAVVLPQRVVILEEDLHVAPDFFGYFTAMAPVLDSDPSLFAVSAFNDNGFQSGVKDPKRVLRSDFFPGLGWMMTRRLWTNELQSKWTDGYWDDWLREPEQRQDRQVLRPEISRTFHFGVHGGASKNQFGNQLTTVMLNTEPVDWTKEKLGHLRPHQYDEEYWALLKAAKRVESLDDALEQSKEENIRLEYASLRHFQAIAKRLHLMTDEKAGIPRTAYKGIVETRPWGEHQLFLTPPIKELKQEFPTVKR